jgi:Uma2 family endonuclease
VRPLRRSEYEQLVEAGAFRDERIELLRGVLVEMSPQKAPHAATIQRLTDRLAAALAGRASLRVQLPLALGEDSEPEPDIAVVAPGAYDREHPSTALLVIEVADSSLEKDRRLKAAIYAASAIEELWVVNLVDRQLEVHLDPDAGRYRRVVTHRGGDAVRPRCCPDVAVEVAEVLPRSS